MNVAESTFNPAERFAHVRWQRVLPWIVAFVLLLLYLPALNSGFLVWDDPWLVEQSGRLTRTGGHDLGIHFHGFLACHSRVARQRILAATRLEPLIEAATVGLQPSAHAH